MVGRELGEGVRHAIEQTGMTQRMLAEVLDWQEAKLSDLANGKGGVNESELRELLAYCRTARDEVNRLVALHREMREMGWLLFLVPDGPPRAPDSHR